MSSPVCKTIDAAAELLELALETLAAVVELVVVGAIVAVAIVTLDACTGDA